MILLIKHTGECDHPDNDTLPVKLELRLRAPEFMSVAFSFLYGGMEEVVARAATIEELQTWMNDHGLETHPRLSRFRITDRGELVRHHNWAPERVPA